MRRFRATGRASLPTERRAGHAALCHAAGYGGSVSENDAR